MFLGTHTPRLDEKGRLILPAKFRDELEEGVVVTRGQERCLYVFPAAEFERLAEQLRQPRRSQQAGARLPARASCPAPPTRSPTSRAGSPSRRRCAATPGSTATAPSSAPMTRVEIWDAAAWEAYLAEQEEAFSDQAEEVRPRPLLTATADRHVTRSTVRRGLRLRSSAS